MALTGTNIIGRIALPDDTNPVNSVVRFIMTGFDTDDTENATVIQIPIDATIDALGDIDVNLWPNPLGVRSTFYATYVRIPDGNTNDVINVYVGQISVPATGGPYDLNDLLPIAPPAGADVADYIAQLAAAVALAESSATAAAASAAEAALFDGPKFDTIALMSAYTTAADGGFAVVWNGENGEHEVFKYEASSVLTADGALIVTAAGMGVGQWISTRKVYTDFAEFIGDRRTFEPDTLVTITGILAVYKAVAGVATGNLKRANLGGQEFDVIRTVTSAYHVEAFGMPAGGDDTETYNAAVAIWAAALADTANFVFGPGVFDVGNRNWPFRQSDASGGLLDCGGISLIATPATTLKTTSNDGADVIQLNGLDNFNVIGFPTITATLTDTIGSGSNGVSVTNGFDRLHIEVYCVNLPSIDETSFIDGGKAVTFQPAATTNKCGTAKVFVRAKGCSYAFGSDLVLTNVAANAMEVDAHVMAEDCYAHTVISGAAATAAITNATNMGFKVRGSSINCQRDIVVARGHGVDIDIDITTTKTAAARRLDPNGVAWWIASPTVDALYCAYAHNSIISVKGDKGACDYKAQIGGTTAGSSGLTGATTFSKIAVDISGSPVIATVNAIDSGGNTAKNCEFDISARTGAVPAVLQTVANANRFGTGPDRYEQGFFTPILADTSLVDEGATYSTQNGKYTRVGNRVDFSLYMVLTGLGALTPTDGASILGLPYLNNTAVLWGEASLVYAANLNLSAAATVSGRILQNTNRITLQKWPATATAGHVSMLISDVSADGTLVMSGHYFTDEP